MSNIADKGIRIIDAHSHPDFHGHNFERSIENMDRNGIAAAWLLAWDTPRDEYDPNSIFAMALPVDDSAPNSFRLCWEYKQKAPDRFILGYAPDPRRPDSIQRMRSAIANYNVQVCGEIKLRMMYDNPDAIEMFRFCGENGLPVTLHFDNSGAQRSRSAFPRPSWWYGGDIDTFERVLKLCPETNFLGHAPGFWCHISNDNLGETIAYPTGPVVPGGRIEVLLDKYPNLYCDCSAGSCLTAISRDRDYSRALISAHPDRFVFARDYYDGRLFAFLESLELPDKVRELVYHGNAERLAAPVKRVYIE
ncbi:MAG: amidohydrolase family protein [Clostridiales bacterium]|nr:amidohydrolase family protein [Clostridiales bacterium]